MHRLAAHIGARAVARATLLLTAATLLGAQPALAGHSGVEVAGCRAEGDPREQAAMGVAFDGGRASERGPRGDGIALGHSMGVATGVSFVVGGTFASLYGFARSRWSRGCGECAAAEQRAKLASPKNDGTWGYVAMGIHAAAFVGIVVLGASTDDAEAPTGKARHDRRVDSLRLVIVPTLGGGALSLSGRF